MSPLPFELALALRYLRPKRTFFSIITLICILGVTLGVAVLMIVIAVMTGFGEQLREQLVSFSAHLSIVQREAPMGNWRATMETVVRNPRVRAVAPFINTQVLVETQPKEGGSRPFAPFVRGIDPVLESRATEISNSIVAGDFNLGPGRLLVGYELADSLGLRVGDRLAVHSLPALKRMREAWEKNAREAVPAQNYVIQGIFDAGLYDLNQNVVVVDLADAQDLHGVDDAITGLSVTLHDPSPLSTREAQETIVRELPRTLAVSTWMEANRKMLGALAVEKNMMFYLLFFIVLVAAFGIMSALITFVVQKTREIGMLKALGATPVQVASLFLAQSFVVGVAGVAGGLGLGSLALHYRNEFLHFMNHRLGFELFPASIYQFRDLPARIVSGDVTLICVVSLVVCVLAGVLPGIRAALLQPVQALRHE
jgi:lipoprotein-releasing system permease protein